MRTRTGTCGHAHHPAYLLARCHGVAQVAQLVQCGYCTSWNKYEFAALTSYQTCLQCYAKRTCMSWSLTLELVVSSLALAQHLLSNLCNTTNNLTLSKILFYIIYNQ